MNEEEASRLRQQALHLINERQQLETVLMTHARMLRGSLLERPKFCGKPGCKCTRGQPHPPGIYLSHLVGDTVRHKFIREVDHERARREALNYRQYRQALRRWRVIMKELSQIWEKLGESQEEDYPFV